MKFPFVESPNTAVITCCHILEDNMPILYVSHDADDGMWQFLCGGAHTEHQARVISLLEIYELDNSIAELSNMPYGWVAVRKNFEENWIIRRR